MLKNVKNVIFMHFQSMIKK